MVDNKEIRKCGLCNEMFTPKRYWQRFCCPTHQKQYWKQVNPFQLKTQIQRLEDKVKVLEEKGEK